MSISCNVADDLDDLDCQRCGKHIEAGEFWWYHFGHDLVGCSRVCVENLLDEKEAERLAKAEAIDAADEAAEYPRLYQYHNPEYGWQRMHY